jgi:hypothetical protein
MHRLNLMHRLTIPVAVVCAGLVATSVAFASSPHFVKGPTYSATTSALTASGKAAGLANEPTAAFLTAEQVDVFYQCRNHGQNFAPGHPATSTGVTGPSKDFAPHNGQITFSVSLPAPVPSAADACPSKKWTVVVSRVDYLGVTLHIQQNGSDILIDGPNDFTAP